MTLFFPFAISQWGEMNVSINRIQVRPAATCHDMIICQDFLSLDEQEEVVHGTGEKGKGGQVVLDNLTGKWREEETEDTLNNINMEVAERLASVVFKAV